DNNSFGVNTEGHIDISLDKSQYYISDHVTALFKTPFSGRMLVTMETDKVLSYQYVDVSDKRNASLTLPLTADDIPNVYITATLIKPHELSDIPLTVAHGYQSVRVEARDRKIPVEISAATAVRSHTHQKVTVKAAPGSLVTLAAVDNGVLQVTGFETPDPYAHFYARRALEVTGYDLYPLLLPEVKSSLSSTGGDEETAMTVADPIVLSSALPRFMSPGDTVTMPVTITNTTGNTANATARLKLTGALRSLGEEQQTVSVSGNSEGHARFELVAPPAVGTGKVTVDV